MKTRSSSSGSSDFRFEVGPSVLGLSLFSSLYLQVPSNSNSGQIKVRTSSQNRVCYSEIILPFSKKVYCFFAGIPVENWIAGISSVGILKTK